MYNTTTFICLRSAIIHDTKMSEPEALLYAYLLNSVIGTLMLFEINDDNDDKATFVILTHFSFINRPVARKIGCHITRLKHGYPTPGVTGNPTFLFYLGFANRTVPISTWYITPLAQQICGHTNYCAGGASSTVWLIAKPVSVRHRDYRSIAFLPDHVSAAVVGFLPLHTDPDVSTAASISWD